MCLLKYCFLFSEEPIKSPLICHLILFQGFTFVIIILLRTFRKKTFSMQGKCIILHLTGYRKVIFRYKNISCETSSHQVISVSTLERRRKCKLKHESKKNWSTALTVFLSWDLNFNLLLKQCTLLWDLCKACQESFWFSDDFCVCRPKDNALLVINIPMV